MNKKYRDVIMFSGGISSFFAALLISKEVDKSKCALLFADTGIEDPDLYRFNQDCQEYLGIELITVRNEKSDFYGLWDKAIPNNRMPFCSIEMKINPTQKWLKNTQDFPTLYFGIESNERHRATRITENWPKYNVKFPLLDNMYFQKPFLLEMIKSLGIIPPRLYSMGFAHNNCGGGCVRAGRSHWIHLLQTLPEVYQKWEDQENLARKRLGKNVSILKGITLSKLKEDQFYNPQIEFESCGCFSSVLE